MNIYTKITTRVVRYITKLCVCYSCFVQAVRKCANQPQTMLDVHDLALSVWRQICHVHSRSAHDGNRPKLIAENLEKCVDICVCPPRSEFTSIILDVALRQQGHGGYADKEIAFDLAPTLPISNGTLQLCVDVVRRLGHGARTLAAVILRWRQRECGNLFKWHCIHHWKQERSVTLLPGHLHIFSDS
jgi:hypothetical protein